MNKEKIEKVLKMIEIELSKEDVQNQEDVARDSNSSEELEPVHEAPKNSSIYPPILVLENRKHLVSILNSSHHVNGFKSCSQYFSRFPNQREDTDFLHNLYKSMSSKENSNT